MTESDGFIKGFGLGPNPLIPASLPEIHHQVQVVFPPRLQDVGGLGKELVPEGIEVVLNLLRVLVFMLFDARHD